MFLKFFLLLAEFLVKFLFHSKKWNDENSDTKSGTIRDRSVPFPCEHAMRSKLVQKSER